LLNDIRLCAHTASNAGCRRFAPASQHCPRKGTQSNVIKSKFHKK
jgi:hypothetical protein